MLGYSTEKWSGHVSILSDKYAINMSCSVFIVFCLMNLVN